MKTGEKYMSFASKTKNELCRLGEDTEPCCKLALAYGILLFSGRFSTRGLRLASENEEVITFARALLREVFFVSPTVVRGQLNISNPSELSKIFSVLGLSPRSLTLRIDQGLFSPCCTGFFLRGALLAGGTVTNPERGYHFEFSTPHYNLSRDLFELLLQVGLSPKKMVRKSNYVIYLKESEQIEDILNLMGAQKAAFIIMDAKIEKELRNTANRITNCETANIDKSVAAALRQAQAIRKLKKSKKLAQLSPQLQEIARLRLRHPELNLAQLGARLEPPLGKSGVNHRLKRLVELADEI